jgi:penicillin-binding protein 1A
MREAAGAMVARVLRFVFRSAVLLVTIGVGVPVVVTSTVLAALFFLPLPATIPQPKTPATILPTQIFDRDGNLIATFRQVQLSIPVSEADIPNVLKEAVVSVEDRNFYKHGGIDIRGSLRALVADVRNQKAVQGGSTITQQYVKNAYTGSARTLTRKVKEAILASQLDRQASKDEILYRYLSTIYLGDGSYGVGAAAQTYFREPVNQLTLSQAAMIAGLVPAPSLWAPRENPDAAENRRELVLDKMEQQGYITAAQHDAALAQKVWLLASGPAPAQATAVFPPATDQPKYPAFVDYVQRYLLAKYGPQLVYQGGLRVQTTLDPRIQDAADATVQNSLKGTAEPLEMSLAAVEPQTGFVDALVGGREFGQGPYADVNLALGGCYQPPAGRYVIDVPATCWNGATATGGGSGRQPGSAWKPFVLATAFSKGVSPDKVYPAPQVYDIPDCKRTPTNSCTIGNNEGEGGGSSDIRHATWYSINTVFAQLVRDVGCKDTGEMAKRLGVTAAWYSPQFHTCSGTYALGVVDVSPLDMASAYGTLDNHGAKADPTPILKVIDADNKVLEDHITTKPPTTQVLDPAAADTVTDVLRGVITGGTGTAANIGRPAAGKTGTTSNYTNAWFVGYTPTLSTAVWMGYANNETTPLRNIRGVSTVYGGTIPAQTWHDFMIQALQGVPVTDFSQAPPIQPAADRLHPTTTAGVTAGPQESQPGTGPGGPYQYGGPAVQIAPPLVTSPSTSTTSTSTTVPPAFPEPPVPPGSPSPSPTPAPPPTQPPATGPPPTVRSTTTTTVRGRR